MIFITVDLLVKSSPLQLSRLSFGNLSAEVIFGLP
jgi:hypothetical protein